MARSLCSSSTAFLAVEIVLCLLAIYFVVLETSHHCVSISTGLCTTGLSSENENTSQEEGNSTVSNTKNGSNGSDLVGAWLGDELHAEGDGAKLRRHVKKRMGPVQSVSCRQLDVLDLSITEGPKHLVFWLAYVCGINVLLCLVLIVNRRASPMKFWENVVLFSCTAGCVLAAVLVQYMDGPVAHLLKNGITASIPWNWFKANVTGILIIVWKIVQFIFDHLHGEATIKVEKPVFKVFDFSKYYTPVTEN